MSRLVLASILLLAMGCRDKGPPPAPPSLSTEEKATAEKLVADAKAAAKEMDAARVAAVIGPPPSKLEPSPTAPCPVDGKKLLPEPPGPDATNNGKRAYSANLLVRTMRLADVIGVDGKPERGTPSATDLEEELRPHETVLKEGLRYQYGSGAAFLDALKKSIAKWNDGHDGVLVQTKRVEAGFLAGSKSVTPGHVAGRFYLWSRKDRRIVCLADVDVTGPRGFIAFGETEADVTANAASQVPHRLTGEAIIAGLTTMHAPQ